ncbi:DUF3343 domain-containing protein [Paenibacillus rhizovicinus]|uniref:DUF3343 domain-containing protein n=1 Tax=Paenibacillus rhizovicinus TaxID=2704463 RepID=A0A6C0P2Z6_9BACL|nr:DUF3343 domain-containing protein [Paenibacillus rhizovicinus]
MDGTTILYLPAQGIFNKISQEARSVLIAFDSTQQALRAEMLLEYAEIEIDICPTPKQITAGCALSIHFPEEDLLAVHEVIVQERVEIRGIFKQIEDQYEAVDI